MAIWIRQIDVLVQFPLMGNPSTPKHCLMPPTFPSFVLVLKYMHQLLCGASFEAPLRQWSVLHSSVFYKGGPFATTICFFKKKTFPQLLGPSRNSTWPTWRVSFVTLVLTTRNQTITKEVMNSPHQHGSQHKCSVI
jgi:hypothetical protein